MPSVANFWEMVSGTTTTHSSTQNLSSMQWPSGGRRQAETEGELRESMARYSAATAAAQDELLARRHHHHHHQEEQFQDEIVDEAVYMRARQHYNESYQRAMDQAHVSLFDLQQQREHREGGYDGQSSSSSQRRSTRQPHQHRVYLINCKHCNHFLTDRGMKAVLLLRPHITLYSTDAAPDCGPIYPDPFADNDHGKEPKVERTCDCLTQTLGCYGCGTAVGYHIVSPCARCTSSVAKHHRSSNGHRTVLHCNEISVRERRYVPGEKSVATAKIEYPITPVVQRSTAASRSDLYSQLFTMQQRNRRRFSVHEVFHDEANDEIKETFLPYTDVMEESWRQTVHIDSTPVQQSNTSASTYLDGRKPRLMKAGDTVYWSDLISGGERHEPIDCDELLAMPVAGR